MGKKRTENRIPSLSAEPVQIEARRLVEEYSISRSDADRVIACLNRCVRVFAAELRDKPDKHENALRRYPFKLLEDAIRSLGVRAAVRLLDGEDLTSLFRRVQMAEYLTATDIPFYTLPELAHHFRAFGDFLKQHRDYIIQTGLPPRCFRPCRWLYLHLGRLYDTRTTGSTYPRDELFNNSTKNANVEPYQWICTPKRKTVSLSQVVSCEYGDADFLKSVRKE